MRLRQPVYPQSSESPTFRRSTSSAWPSSPSHQSVIWPDYCDVGGACHGTVNPSLRSTLMSAVRDCERTSRKVPRMKRLITSARLMPLVAIGLAGSMILSTHTVRARTTVPAAAGQSAAVSVAHLLRYSAAAFALSPATAHTAVRHSARTGVNRARGSHGRSGASRSGYPVRRLASTSTVRSSYARHRIGTMAGRYATSRHAATGTARSCPHMTSSTSTSTSTQSGK